MRRLHHLVNTLILASLADTPPAHAPTAAPDTGADAYTLNLAFGPADLAACNETRLWLRGGVGTDGQPWLDADLTIANVCRSDPAQQFLLNAYFRTHTFTLRADPRLETAVLSATLPVVACNGEICAWVGSSLDVDLTLAATGEPIDQSGDLVARPVIAQGRVAGRWETFALAPSAEGVLGRIPSR